MLKVKSCGHLFGTEIIVNNLFDRPRSNIDTVRKVKQLVIEHFNLSEATIVSIAELRCHEEGCPPLETIITARHEDGTTEDWRIIKPINKILPEDIKFLNTK